MADQSDDQNRNRGTAVEDREPVIYDEHGEQVHEPPKPDPDEGPGGFKGAISKEVAVTFTVPGVYGVKCTPHFALGMVALVVVGDDLSNLDAAKAAKVSPKAGQRLEALFSELGK